MVVYELFRRKVEKTGCNKTYVTPTLQRHFTHNILELGPKKGAKPTGCLHAAHSGMQNSQFINVELSIIESIQYMLENRTEFVFQHWQIWPG
jgi:hypothetical protein